MKNQWLLGRDDGAIEIPYRFFTLQLYREKKSLIAFRRTHAGRISGSQNLVLFPPHLDFVTVRPVVVREPLFKLEIKVKSVADQEHQRVRLYHKVVLTESEDVESLTFEIKNGRVGLAVASMCLRRCPCVVFG